MNLLFSCIGKRGYIPDFFRPCLQKSDRIIGTSNTKWTPGFGHCDKNYILPDIASDEYIPAVKKICSDENISAILSFFDPDVVALAKHFDEFVQLGITPVIPRYEIAETCFDKFKTYHFFVQQGFKTAKTYRSLEEANKALSTGEIAFPLFVKPRYGFGSAHTFKANKRSELDVFFNYVPDMIIQEELTGEAVNLDMLNDLDGKVISAVPWRKYRSRMGETEQAATFESPSLLDYGVQLGTALAHIGPLDTDIFYKDGQYYVLEVNLRFGGGYPVSHLAGGDFPRKIIRLINGEKLAPDIGNYRRDVVMMKDNLVIGGDEGTYFNSLHINHESR